MKRCHYHPRYNAKRWPETGCIACVELYLTKNNASGKIKPSITKKKHIRRAPK